MDRIGHRSKKAASEHSESQKVVEMDRQCVWMCVLVGLLSCVQSAKTILSPEYAW